MSNKPIYNEHAEKAVLGSILIENHALRSVMPGMQAQWFWREPHRLIFAAFVELARDGAPIDIVTVEALLQKKGHLRAAGGMSYLVSLLNETPASTNIAYHAAIVRQLAALRNTADVARKVWSKCQKFEGLEDHTALVDEAQRELIQAFQPLKKRARNAGRQSIGTVAKCLFEQLERSQSGNAAVDVLDITTTFPSLDKRVRIPRGAMTVVAGEPGSGKSSLMRTMCFNWAKKHNLRPHIIKTEDVNMHTVLRQVASDTGLRGRTVRDIIFRPDRSGIDRRAEDDVVRALVRLMEVDWTVEDTSGMTVEEVCMQAREAVGDGADIVVVDTFTRIKLPNWRGANDTAKIDHNIECLCSVAQELNIALLVGAHMSRIKAERLPNMSDLRGSGNWENNARLILMPHRRMGNAVIVIAKANHDDGGGGAVELKFDEPQTRWREPGYKDRSEPPCDGGLL